MARGYYAKAICEACGGESFKGYVAVSHRGLDLECSECGTIDKGWRSSAGESKASESDGNPALESNGDVASNVVSAKSREGGKMLEPRQESSPGPRKEPVGPIAGVASGSRETEFDRTAYQREYMRKRRAAAKGKAGPLRSGWK